MPPIKRIPRLRPKSHSRDPNRPIAPHLQRFRPRRLVVPLAAALAEGVRSGMIEEVPGWTLAHRFTHELVRRALYDRLPAGRRAELHLRIGQALD